VSARLNALTNSVSQLLASQTHQQPQSGNGLSINPGQAVGNSLDGSFKQQVPQNFPPNSAVGLGFPQRPEFRGSGRIPNSLPTRTWSTGNIEVAIGSTGSAHRHEIFRGGKRGSVAVYPRKDSPGVS
jgi:hypothetical protein